MVFGRGRTYLGIRVKIVLSVGLLRTQEHLLAELVAVVHRVKLIICPLVAKIICVPVICGSIQVIMAVLLIKIILDLRTRVVVVGIVTLHFGSSSVMLLLPLVVTALVALVLNYV